MDYRKAGNKVIKLIAPYLVFLLASFSVDSYQKLPPFHKEIQEFKKQDSVRFPPKNAILFIGSSSFTKWKAVQDSFPGYPVINRAFGGSTLPNLIYYANDIIIPYRPKQVIVYCGDNDLASADTLLPTTVLERFVQLFGIIRNKYPKAHISYVSIKPSPSRLRLMPRMVESNMLVADFLKKKKRTSFIDVYHPMLLRDGRPDPTLFVSDSLHMNAKGYAIWTKTIEPYLIKR